jgi:transcriptional regulator with AAA-type ATPase domain
LVSDAVEGASPAMRRVQTLIRRIAPTDRPVLLLGPTGCGKEVIAQQIHLHGLHSRSPFTDINCSSIPESLMEAELFGHERGAFTGAVTSRPGYLAQVGDGTLFLDEIGDLPLSLQPKLLRVLETRQFRAVGSGATIAFRGRIVAATHRDLLQMVRDGRFREDLYYRLNVFTIEIPGLDQRREDIPALAQYFASRQSRALRFQDDALKLMAQAPWPGNVRQLRNIVDRIAVLSDGDCIDATAVAPFLAGSPLQAPESFEEIADRLLEMAGGDKISAIEHLLVDRALRSCDGNKTAAARMLGVNRKVVERRVQSHTERIHDARRQTAEARVLMESSAYSRAALNLGAALDTLRSLPPLPDERQIRFEILSQLAVCKRSQDGWLSGEALGIYAEALRVGRGLVEPQELNALMFGSWSAHLMRLELNQAHVLAEEIRLRGIEANDVNLQIDGCIAVANTRFWLAEFDGALKMIDELRSLPGFGVTPVLRQGMNPVALAAMVEALAAYQQGDRPRMQRARDELRNLSATLEHAFSLAIVLQGCAWTECLLGNLDEAGQWAERLLDVSSAQGFVFYHGVAQIFVGYALSTSRPAEAERMMRSGFDDEMATHGGLLFHSFYSLLLSRHYLDNGQPDRAEVQAQKAIQICIARRELAYLADLLCVRGKALAAMGDLEASAGEVHNAVATALGLGCMPAREEALAALAATSLSTERPCCGPLNSLTEDALPQVPATAQL